MIESAAVLLANAERAIAESNLGPAVVDKPNDPYWEKAAKVFEVPLDVAKRRLCVNCEYYDNSPERLAELESIPLNKYDVYNSQGHRGYCHKLHIICHTTRSCEEWEAKAYVMPDDADEKDLASKMYPSML